MINYIKNLRKKSIDREAGFISGYYIDRIEYQKVYDAATKKDRAWKTPVYLKSIIYNPSLLLLQEKWIVDEQSFERALQYFKIHEGLSREVDRLSALFRKLNNITFINLQDYLLEREDIDEILRTMTYYNERRDHFNRLIHPLEVQYQDYAYPNNFEFEKMNAGIIKVLSRKYPNLTPLDDVLRSPVYEDLEITRNIEINQDINIMNNFLAASSTVLKPIPFIPKNWDVNDYIRLHKSRGAEQIREILHQLKQDPNLSVATIERYIDRMNDLARDLSPTKTIIYSLGGLTAGVAGTAASIAIPWLFAASILGTAVSAAQLVEGLSELSKKRKLDWLNLSSEIAKWNLNSA